MDEFSTLFPLPEPRKCETCRSCVHRFTYSYTHTTISYCDKKRSNLTSNGKKKIKVADPACIMYEARAVKKTKQIKPV